MREEPKDPPADRQDESESYQLAERDGAKDRDFPAIDDVGFLGEVEFGVPEGEKSGGDVVPYGSAARGAVDILDGETDQPLHSGDLLDGVTEPDWIEFRNTGMSSDES